MIKDVFFQNAHVQCVQKVRATRETLSSSPLPSFPAPDETDIDCGGGGGAPH